MNKALLIAISITAFICFGMIILYTTGFIRISHNVSHEFVSVAPENSVVSMVLNGDPAEAIIDKIKEEDAHPDDYYFLSKDTTILNYAATMASGQADTPPNPDELKLIKALLDMGADPFYKAMLSPIAMSAIQDSAEIVSMMLPYVKEPHAKLNNESLQDILIRLGNDEVDQAVNEFYASINKSSTTQPAE